MASMQNLDGLWCVNGDLENGLNIENRQAEVVSKHWIT